MYYILRTLTHLLTEPVEGTSLTNSLKETHLTRVSAGYYCIEVVKVNEDKGLRASHFGAKKDKRSNTTYSRRQIADTIPRNIAFYFFEK